MIIQGSQAPAQQLDYVEDYDLTQFRRIVLEGSAEL